MKRLLSAFTVIAAMLALASTPAFAETHNGVTCNTFGTPTGVWPEDNVHAWNCYPAGTKSTVVFNAFQSLPKANLSYPADHAWEVESKAGASVYYFHNRTDAINFMTGKFGAGSTFIPTVNHCGYTGYTFAPFTQTIISEVFDRCHYDNPTNDDVANPDIQQTALHEAGHAYDFGLASRKILNRGQTPSQSTGFQKLVGGVTGVTGDLQNMDAASIHTCTLFDSAVPSALELQLGAKFSSAVCTGSTVNPPYVGQANSVIALEESPYFLDKSKTPAYKELWAEEFTSSGVSLPFIDRIIIQNPGGMICSKWALQSLYVTGNLPIAAGRPYPAGCPAVPDSDFGL